MTVEPVLAGVALAIWLYLVMAHGGFRRAPVRDDADVAPGRAQALAARGR
jgi:hypothetical protein